MFDALGIVLFCISLYNNGIEFDLAPDGHVRYGTELHGGCW